jgi:hypothetical protein
MTRAVGLVLALTLVGGCTDGDAPPVLSTDMGVGSGGCSSLCDCPAGDACNASRMCEPSSKMIFCCGATSCSGTSACEFPNGTVSQCDRSDGGGVPPVVDGGLPPGDCSAIGCTRGAGGDLFCQLACGDVNASCVKSGGIEHCMP